MKTLLTAIAILFTIHCYSQKDITFPIIKASLFDWKDIEKEPSKSAVDKFIKVTPKEFQAYKQKDPDMAFLNLDSLRKDLHFLDLNNDGKEDVVFEGQSGGEAREVAVFIAIAQTYQKVFTAFQGIVKMEWQQKRLVQLYIDDWGCCDDYLQRHKVYDVSYNPTGMPIFKKVYQGLSIDEGVTPDTLLENPFRFEVLNDGYKIRSAPKIDDTSVQPWDTGDEIKEKGSGNSIGKLIKGATGTAIAKRLDSTGREWLFVQIDEPYLPKNDIIYVENKFPTKLMGWISSRFIKTL